MSIPPLSSSLPPAPTRDENAPPTNRPVDKTIQMTALDSFKKRLLDLDVGLLNPDEHRANKIARIGELDDARKTDRSEKPENDFVLREQPLGNRSFHPGYRVQLRSARRSPPIQEALICGGYLSIGKNRYQVEVIGEGKHHRVFRFTDTCTISVVNQKTGEKKSINLDEVVLRTRNPLAGVKNAKTIISSDYAILKHCRENNIPIPIVYLAPHEFYDADNPNNGGFWLIEKMKEKVSLEGWGNGQSYDQLSKKDQQVLSFVKFWLTKNYTEKRELIADLHPGNLMWDKNDELKVIDTLLPDDEDWKINLVGMIRKWSNGNSHIKAFLSEKLTELTQE
ncbi:MAG: hypothetical protein ACSNEK_05700 [Parachlamydiaceae bacterium]